MGGGFSEDGAGKSAFVTLSNLGCCFFLTDLLSYWDDSDYHGMVSVVTLNLASSPL